MVFLALSLSIISLGLVLWCVMEIRELKSRWARLYGLRTAMVETETALQKLMNELHASGEALIEDIDRRFARAQDLEALLRAQGGASGLADANESGPTVEDKARKTGLVIALAQQGYTVEAISTEVEMPRGEVQLILDLERVRK